MHDRCAACELPLEREPGFYLGSVYFNYLATAIVTTGLFLWLTMAMQVARPYALAAGVATATVFPVLFFRFARGLWLFGDFFFDRTPQSGKLPPGEQDAPDFRGAQATDAPSAACMCPFCHRRFDFPTSRAGTWGVCPKCRGQVLLVTSP